MSVRTQGPHVPRVAFAAMMALVALGIAAPAWAQDATWLTVPGSGDFSTATNWTPNAVPTGTAFFGTSSTTSLSFSDSTTSLGGWTFNSGASAYTFTATQDLAFTGAGIVVNGGSVALISNYRINLFNGSSLGSATFTNNGYVYLNDSSSAGNATIINNGVSFQFANASTAANANITNNSLMYFSDTATAASSSITNSATGDFRFYNTSTAGNATIVNNNLAYFNDASTAASATIVNNSLLYFYTNSTAGQARLISNAGASIDFSGTTGPAGDGRITAGSIEGAGNFALGSSQLSVGSNNLSTTVSGTIQDGGFSGGSGGSIVKTGSGTLTLAGVNTYTGATAVESGTLNVTGSIATSNMTTVDTGAILTGAGTVGNLTVAGGGIFNPGNGSAGSSMTVSGNLALASGAQYQVQVNPSTASFAAVTGTATLGGATVNATYANGSYISKQYTILTAGSVSGTFGTLTNINLPSNFSTALSYDNKNAYLNLTLNFTPPPRPPPVTPPVSPPATPPPAPTAPSFGALNLNQQAVGNALINFFNTTGGIPMVFGALTPAGLTQASGELATGSQQTTFDAMNLFMGLLTDPFVAGRGDGATAGVTAPIGYASTQTNGAARDAYAMFTKLPPVTTFEQRWNVWAAGFGGSQMSDGNAVLGSNNSTSSVYGTAVGADYRISPFTVAGFALAGGGTSFSVAGSGFGHSDLFQAGAFVRHTVGPAYLSAALAYGWQDITTDRTVTVAGFNQLQAKFNANAFSGRLEGGYRFATPWMGVTPYAAAQVTAFDLPAYAESVLSGASTFALAYNAKDVTDTRSELGLRTDKSYALTDSILTLRGRLAWAHDFDPDRSIAATFQALPGASFVVNGAAQAHDSALTTAAAEIKWRNGWSVAATFEGEFSDVTASYAGKGVVRYVW
jgi:autotransporter-associated beta strand protein